MKSWKVVPVFALAGAMWLHAAPASAHGMRPCRDDVKRLCGDAQYSHSGIVSCLDQHASELSPACQKRVAKVKAHVEEFKQACGDDTQKLCASADHGWATYRCLRDHNDDLSAACKEQVAEVHQRHHHRHHHDAEPAPGESTGS